MTNNITIVEHKKELRRFDCESVRSKEQRIVCMYVCCSPFHQRPRIPRTNTSQLH